MDTPDTRLISLHAENGSPHARLSQALGALEGADWGLLLCGEMGLARQLAALFGPGTLRVDSRIKVDPQVFAGAGLAVAHTDADWRGARAVWLLEPDERDIRRAARAGVSLIVDGTLSPGGDWLSPRADDEAGAAVLIYRSGAVLSGFGDLELSAIFGKGKAPVRSAPAPSDLHLALVLRDLATLPLRLRQSARTVAELAQQLGGQAQVIGHQALLLAPDSAADTLSPLGGVLVAAQNVQAGTLMTPGVQSAAQVMALLRQEALILPTTNETRDARSKDPAKPQDPTKPHSSERPTKQAQEPAQNQGNQSQEKQHRELRPQPRQPERQAKTEQGKADHHRTPDRPAPRQDVPATLPAATAALDYTPEIVFSESLTQHQPSEGSAILTQITPVSSGPDEPDMALSNPEVQGELLPELSQPQPVQQAETSAQTADTAFQHTELNLPPDLPATQQEAIQDVLPGLSDAQQQIYARLRDWRNAEAKRLEISRFIVASNATLAAIAQRLPQTEAELREIRGMGPERVKRYGETMLGLVRQG